MKHYIITRFNLNLGRWVAGEKQKTDVWLDRRFELFRNYCLPSLVNQTVQDFTWLVFFDLNTPAAYRNLIAEIAAVYKNFTPLFIEGRMALNASVVNFIKNKEAGGGFVIMTRIDNDDALHRDFVGEVQCLSRPENDLVIDVRQGYQMILLSNITEFRLRRRYRFNPFISLIQSVDLLQSIYSKDHEAWANGHPVVVSGEKPLWIQVVHGENRVNRVDKYSELVHDPNLSEFGFSVAGGRRGLICVKICNFLIFIREVIKKCGRAVLKAG